MATGTIGLDLNAFIPDPSSPPEKGVFSGSNRPYWAFDGTANLEKGIWMFPVPENYASGLLAKVQWCASASTSSADTVEWRGRIMAVTPNTDNVAIDTESYGTVNSQGDDVIGTVAKRLHEVTLTITNADSLVANDYAAFQFERDYNIGTDDLAEDAWLLGIKLEYTTT